MSKFILVLAFAITLSGGAHAEQELRLLANTSPPYAGEKLPDQGLALELVKHIFAQTNYHPDITIENWSRAVEGTRVGVYDALASVWYSPDREKDLLFSDPYLRSELLILKLRSNSGDYDSLQQLEGRRLGVRADYAYGVDFSAIPDLALIEEDLLVSNLLNLLNGKIDFVIADQRTAAMQLHEYFDDKITQFAVTGITLPPVKRHVAASRSWDGDEKMVAEFNRALIAVQKDGSAEAIIRKWDERYGGID
jgi:polar amino acid transport system substrate-binding protein